MESDVNVYTLTQDLILRNVIYQTIIRIICALEQLLTPLPYSRSKTNERTKCSSKEKSLYGFQTWNLLLESAQGYFRDSFLSWIQKWCHTQT